MVEIKELYAQTYKKTLADDIKEHFKEDVRNILLALINGKSSPAKLDNSHCHSQSNLQCYMMISYTIIKL